MGEEVKAVIPESVLKKRKREEEWALAKKQQVEALKKKNAENRKLIFNRAKQYSKEYAEKVLRLSIFFLIFFSSYNCCLIVIVSHFDLLQEKELIQLKREAKLKGGFYVEPEAKLLFIIRIRGYVLGFSGFDLLNFFLFYWR